MRVAEAVRSGKVKVTLSFPSWPEGKVAAASFEVAVLDESGKVEK